MIPVITLSQFQKTVSKNSLNTMMWMIKENEIDDENQCWYVNPVLSIGPARPYNQC